MAATSSPDNLSPVQTRPITNVWADTWQTSVAVASGIFMSGTLALLLVYWEDYTAGYTRYRYMPIEQQYNFGQGTVRGLTFQDGDSPPAFQSVMLEHRTSRVPRWRRPPSSSFPTEAVHTLVSLLQDLPHLRQLSHDYQWLQLREALQPWKELEPAAWALRSWYTTDAAATYFNNDDRRWARQEIGFDWAACAWRHCGATADAQEAVDELDHHVGLLEPFEVDFILQIMEQSVRDILATLPAAQWQSNEILAADRRYWLHELPPYPAHHSSSETNQDSIDEAYFRALQDLRID
jgi:hypothetical protein